MARRFPTSLISLAIAVSLLAGCYSASDDPDDAGDAPPEDTAVSDTMISDSDTKPAPDTTDSEDTRPADTTVRDTSAHDTSDASDASDTDATAGVALISNDAWSRIDAGSDPLSDHRPTTVECPDSALTQETLQGEETYTVNTGNCNYLSVGQPSKAAVSKGDELSFRIWHFELTNNAPAEAHVAILIDGETVWDKRVPIPADGGLLNKRWKAQRDYPSGSEVIFHLHNHGSNTWNFIELLNRSGS